MENKSSKILLGCGVVFGIFVVLLVLIGFGIYTFVKNASEKQDEIVQLNNFIEEKYGKVEDFLPPQKNIVDSVKFVLFLSIRDSLTEYNDEITSDLGVISEKIKSKEEDLSFFETIGVMKRGLDLIPSFFLYVKKRNEFLIKYDLSLGDYFYYYVLSYYSFLKKGVSDGPPFNLVVPNGNDGEVLSFNNNKDEKDSEKLLRETKRKRKMILSGKINSLFIKFFENGFSSSDSVNYQIYSEELSLLKENEMRIPWIDGLPKEISDFFSKFNVEETYNPMINSIEMELITNE